MKKIIAALLCGLTIAATFAGCGYQDALSKNKETTAPTDSASTEDEAKEKDIKASDYKNDLNGLEEYFLDLGYLVKKDGKLDDSTVNKMRADLIGAEKGYRYSKAFNDDNITIELYVYDTKDLNDTAKKIIADVKDDGEFEIIDGYPNKAFVSDNGKYLMIYKDNKLNEDDTSSTNYERRDEVVEKFEAFYK